MDWYFNFWSCQWVDMPFLKKALTLFALWQDVLLSWKMTSSLNITFIELSTLHDCFSVTHCKLVYFCFGVGASFCLVFLLCKSYFIQLISYSYVANIDFCFCLYIFHLIHYVFSIFKAYRFDFSILILWHLLLSSHVFLL